VTDTTTSIPTRPASGEPCLCGSGNAFDACCEPLLKGEQIADNAERLMRSRFTAHALEDFKYLHTTYVPTVDTPYADEEYDSHIHWTKLEIHSHDPEVRPGISHVDFSAYFSEKGRVGVMHEKSEFIQRDGVWLFNRPLREGPAPVVAAVKVGRNDPCTCGSGKKYKKCCG
jgi:SEC-C motif-containing protein